ncbi:Polyketide cyclase/dehydrase [Planoprotostelium fungivorum]|uniref:Polyketide cyclase/dehydrase n=1 Tax=Planoprotostelium fungivorum TaxID=1890364 RepID=A0A2P6MZR7_9EUKA|nr:Polyketide cyclase/dehydrase [Planoprotostelium fungivorum]
MSNWRDSISTSIDITAPPAKVFSVLTDFETYPLWNPFLLSVTPSTTPVLPGITLTNIIKSGDSNMTFRPTVTAFQKDRRFEWLGKLLWGGLFDGRHHFTIVESKEGGCTLVHGEDFSGLIVWLGRISGGQWYKNLMQQTRGGFIRMNEELKRRTEETK